MIVTDWHGLYRDGHGDSLSPESYAHPAKVSYALARKIYDHCCEEGWLSAGSVVLDPFAGIGGFAREAMRRGCIFIGIELEQPFVDCASGCECTGVSRADWVRFYGRMEKARYLDGRHICPRCIAEAKRILPPVTGQIDLFGHTHVSASYQRNSGRIPEVRQHHYEGNVERWKRMGMPGQAVILQGDSRKLLAWGRFGPGAEMCVGSPPYAQGLGNANEYRDDNKALADASRDIMQAKAGKMADTRYSSSPSNLGNMKATQEGFECCISSGPYPSGGHHPDQTGAWGGQAQANTREQAGYGRTEGQLGQMKADEAGFQASLCVSSPPYAHISPEKNSSGIDIEKQWQTYRSQGGGLSLEAFREQQQRHSAGYGSSVGQLAAMKPGSLEAAIHSPDCLISSPPYEATLSTDGHGIKDKRRQLNPADCQPTSYGGPDNLGNSSGQDFWSAARQILEQVFICLRPGGHAIWVTKRYVRNGKIVEFSQQWAQLCEAVGFRLVHWHRCWLTEDSGTQGRMDGGHDRLVKERKSFFRRLAEKKGSPRIDWEDVICLEKPA
jgi:hypothetical protein